jgi:hypothetical protein
MFCYDIRTQTFNLMNIFLLLFLALVVVKGVQLLVLMVAVVVAGHMYLACSLIVLRAESNLEMNLT